MQADQREALEDPRPVVGIMAHAYANPLIKAKKADNDHIREREEGPQEAETSESSRGMAAAAANELVIDALLAAQADTIGPEVRFLSLPKGTAAIPEKKPHGGAWRGADGLRVVESALPEGLVKRFWLRKHTRELPGSLVYLASVDVSAGAEEWADVEDEIVADLRSVVATLAARDVKVLLVIVRAGVEAGQAGGREERDVADERALTIRRRAEIDARFVLMVGEPDLASRGNPPSVRRIAKAAKDLAISHYATHISRLRRWEKVLVPTQRLYRPLLVRLYFKLGVLHEMQGLIDRSVLCYQEVAALLSDMVPRDEGAPAGLGWGRGSPCWGGGTRGYSTTSGADPMEQIRGVAEVVHLRLVRNHLHRSMSLEGAIRQLRRHVSAFGRPFSAASATAAGAAPAAAASDDSPSASLRVSTFRNGAGPTAAAASPLSAASPPASGSGGGVRGGESGNARERDKGQPGGAPGGAGREEGGSAELSGWSGVVPYRHHAWLSRQYLVFGEMLGAHGSQFTTPPARGGAGQYLSPGYYYLGAALQAVRRRKTSDRLLHNMDEAELRASLDGLEVRETVYLGESVRLVDSRDPERNLQRECRAFLDLEEAKADRVGVARSLLVKALEHCPPGVDVFRRRRVLILSHLGEESFFSGRYDEALERLPTVWKTYLDDGWLHLAAVALRRVYASAWQAGKAKTAADTALRLSSEALRPWVPTDEVRQMLAESLPLVGALALDGSAAAAAAGGGEGGVEGRREFVPSVPPEQGASEELEVAVGPSRLLVRLSGRFSAAEASPGDAVVLSVGLLSLLPLETRLESIELSFNHPALNCTIQDTLAAAMTTTAVAVGNEPAAVVAASTSGSWHSADLTLPPGALLTADVGLCLPWEELPSSEPLRLVGARALMRGRGGGGGGGRGDQRGGGVALSVPAGPGSDIAREAGGGKWARAPGFESVRLVPSRARAHVRIAEPSSVLLGMLTRLLVTVSAMPIPAAADASGECRIQDAAAAAAATGGGGRGTAGGNGESGCGQAPHPFRGGYLHLECEPAPVPPPKVTQRSSISSPAGAGQDQARERSSSRSPSPPSSPPSPPPSRPPLSPPRPYTPVRPRPDRAFFWARATLEEGGAQGEAAGVGGGVAAGADDHSGGGGGGDFLPVIVGADGQPVEGIPLPLPPPRGDPTSSREGAAEQVTVPVWVRSETAGRVAVRARVVYGMGGKPPPVPAAGVMGGGGSEGELEGGVAMTEWVRAEVLCVRPLAVVVDVVSLQANDNQVRGGGVGAASPALSTHGQLSGHAVAVKVTVTNLQEKRLVIARMEVMPPSAPLPPSHQISVTNLLERRLVISRSDVLRPSSPPSPPLPSSTDAATASSSTSPADVGGGSGDSDTDAWANLPNGVVLLDGAVAGKAAPEASDSTASDSGGGGGGGGGSGGVAAAVALPGTGDSYTCCFAAQGYPDRPAPLGRLRITWRAEEAAAAAAAGTGAGNAAATPLSLDGAEEEEEKETAALDGAVTEFPLPVLKARPPSLSARLKVPPHARVGEQFSMSWEISNLTEAYSSMQLLAEDGGEFIWSGKRLCMLQVAPMETVSVVFRLVPKVPGHVLLPTVAVVPTRDKVNIIPDLTQGRPHIFVRP